MKRTVLECKYSYAAWYVDTAYGRGTMHSAIKEFLDRHDVDLYRTFRNTAKN